MNETYYQVVRHIPQEDGTMLDVPTIDIFKNKKDAEELASKDTTGLFAFCGITKTVKPLTSDELDKFLRSHIK
jgi:hypothetical protein